MFNKKVYGQSQTNSCAFCSKIATTKNSQELPACVEHIKNIQESKKCVCGEFLDIKQSKWGAFYLCKNCGPISPKKANDMEAPTDGCGFKLNKKFREQVTPAIKPTVNPIFKSIPQKKPISTFWPEEKPRYLQTEKQPQNEPEKTKEKIPTLMDLVKEWEEEKKD